MNIRILYMLYFLLLAGCGGNNESNETLIPNDESGMSKAKFSIAISDAPVDDAIAVVIEIDAMRLIDSLGSTTEISEFVTNTGETSQSVTVNLLDYQGQDYKTLVDQSLGYEFAPGSYEIELVIKEQGSFVELNDDANLYSIKVPSSRLRLGKVVLSSDLEQLEDLPAYIIEMDLRQALVLRGNNENNQGFILKPHGVRVVSSHGTISGMVSVQNLNLEECSAYLYKETVEKFADLFDSNDDFFQGEVPDAAMPVSSQKVKDDGGFTFSYVEPGNYIVALYCGEQQDDNIQYDALQIPTPDNALVELTLEHGQVKEIEI